MVDRVGQQFGSYRLVRLLGQGGFADVYLGKHIYLDRQAAIKILQTRLTQQDQQSFLVEARTIADLAHPNIVHVLDFGVEGNESIPFLVMEYAPHGTLRQRYPQGARLPLNEVVSYVKQVADALQYAHNKGVIHRDVKPENMLVGQKGEIQLSDFGIAVVSQSSRYQGGQEVGGTVAYMAPEQLQGKPKPASDQYALGVVVYELLSGARPYSGSFAEIGSQHIFAPLPSLREKVPILSEEVEHVVHTALEKDPQRRFGSIRAFANALEQASLSADGPTQTSQAMAALYGRSDPYQAPVPPPPPFANAGTPPLAFPPGNQTPPPPPNQGYAPAQQQAPGGYSPSPSGIQPPIGSPQSSPKQIVPEQPAPQPMALPVSAANPADQTTQMQSSSSPRQDAVLATPVQTPGQFTQPPAGPTKRRGNLGYMAIIVLLILIIVGGGSAWAFSTLRGGNSPTATNSSPNLTATSQAQQQSVPTPDVNATATAYAVNLVTPTSAVPSTTPAVTPTPGSSGKMYNATTKNLQLTCISSCSDNLVTVITSISLNATTNTMTWQFTITNNGNSVCNVASSMDLEDPTGAKLQPDSGTFTDTNTINSTQSIPLTAVFSSVPKTGVLYLMHSSIHCGYFGGDNQVEQFTF